MAKGTTVKMPIQEYMDLLYQRDTALRQRDEERKAREAEKFERKIAEGKNAILLPTEKVMRARLTQILQQHMRDIDEHTLDALARGLASTMNEIKQQLVQQDIPFRWQAWGMRPCNYEGN